MHASHRGWQVYNWNGLTLMYKCIYKILYSRFMDSTPKSGRCNIRNSMLGLCRPWSTVSLVAMLTHGLVVTTVGGLVAKIVFDSNADRTNL